MPLKKTINLIFLSISIAMSTYFLIQATDNIFIKAILVLFSFALEVSMQYILALAKFKWRHGAWQKGFIKLRVISILLCFCYALYIFVYNIPSGVGFIAHEISAQEQAYDKIVTTENINKKRLDQVNATIDNLNAQLAHEANTGFGTRSKGIVQELDKLSADQKELEAKLSTPTNKAAVISRTVFDSLSDVTRVPVDWLKMIVFGVSIGLLCVVLIITSWDIKDENVTLETPTEQPKVTHVTDEPKANVTVVTADVTPKVTIEFQECACGCGRTFPKNPKRKYFNDTHKMRANRSKKKVAEG